MGNLGNIWSIDEFRCNSRFLQISSRYVVVKKVREENSDY